MKKFMFYLCVCLLFFIPTRVYSDCKWVASGMLCVEDNVVTQIKGIGSVVEDVFYFEDGLSVSTDNGTVYSTENYADNVAATALQEAKDNATAQVAANSTADQDYTDTVTENMAETDAANEFTEPQTFESDICVSGNVLGSFYGVQDSIVPPPVNFGDGLFVWNGVRYWRRDGVTIIVTGDNATIPPSYDINIATANGFVEDATFNAAWDAANLNGSWTLEAFYYPASKPPTRTLKTYPSSGTQKRAILFTYTEQTNLSVDVLKTPLTAGVGKTHYAVGWIYCHATGQDGGTGTFAPLIGVGLTEIGEILNMDHIFVGARYENASAAYYSLTVANDGSASNTLTDVPTGQWAFYIITATSTTATLKIYGADGTSDIDTSVTIKDIDDSWDNIYAGVITRSYMTGASTGTSYMAINQLSAWTE